MAHLVHNPKRRRLDQAALTLSKPFRSPLRTPLKKPDEKENNSPADPLRNKNDSTLQKNTDPSGPQPEEKKPGVDNAGADAVISTPLKPSSGTTISNSTTTGATTPVCKTPLPTLRKRKSLASPLSSSPSIPTSDPVLSALQKQHSALQRRLSALRSELDTAQQALRIESSTKDEELEALIKKWRAISQDAAEEVFAGARERVHRMGGVGAWRERMRRGREKWDDEEVAAEECGGGSDVDEEELERRRAEMLDQVEFDEEKVKKRKGDDYEEGADDESFTMDMMLKFLNIDLDLIGFDKVNQRWIRN